MGIWHREGRGGQANRWRGNNRLVPHLKLERGPPCRRQPPIIHRDGHRIKVGSSMAGWDTGKVWIEALWASLSFCVGRKGLGISFLLHGKKKTQVKGHVICHRVNALKRQTRLVSRTWWKQKHKTKNTRLPNTPLGTSAQRTQGPDGAGSAKAANREPALIIRPYYPQAAQMPLSPGEGWGRGRREMWTPQSLPRR